MTYRRGTNQYRTKPKHKFWGVVVLAILFLIPVCIMGYKAQEAEENASIISHIISPIGYIAKGFTIEKALADTSVLDHSTPEYQQIHQEIQDVFGQYAPKAFALLDCENHSLNPNAMNDNTKWGGVGRDWGVFQINDVWQNIGNPAFLTDYKINIRVAWRIYANAGYNFHLWSCGQRMGI